jgi:zinc protease
MSARQALPWILLGVLASCEGTASQPRAPWIEPPDEPFRQNRPPPGPARDFQIPGAQLFTIADGTEVLLFERHIVPMVVWALQYPAGSILDPVGKEGRTELCAWLMLQSGDETADLLADLGSSVLETWDTEHVWLNGFSLRSHIDATLDLWGRFVRSPVVDATELEMLRARSIAALPQTLATPAAIASRVLAVTSFGPGHPFARRPTAESYRAITLDDCAQFVADQIRPNGSLLLVAGDITRALIEEKFAPRLLAAARPPAAAVPPVRSPSPDPAQIVFADAPGASQAIVYLWSPGPARQAPDYVAASMMVEIFGGDALASRLGMDLREMMGSTYSVGGGINAWKTGGRLTINAPVQADRTAAAIAAIVANAQKMREADVTDAELARVRDGRIAALPGRFETVSAALGEFSDLHYYGLPLDYYQSYAAMIGQVDKAAINAAARQYLTPEQLHFVVVGDAKVVRPMLDAVVAPGGPLAGATLKVVGPDGKPLQ